MDLSRRRVLFGLGGAALLTCGSGLAWVKLGYKLPANAVPVGLSQKELCVVAAIVEALLPEDGDLPSGLSLSIHQRIDEEVWSASPELAADLKSALSLIEHIPPFFGFWGRFTRLSPEERLACYEALLLASPSPVVAAAVAYKQMCSLFYYSHPSVWPAIGYDGAWVPRPSPPPSSLRYAELLKAAGGRS